MTGPLLSVAGLSISSHGPLGPRLITMPMDLTLDRGQTLAIVGESGSGKSLTAKAIVRLLPAGVSATGSVRLDDVELTALPEREMQGIRGHRIALLLQDPFTMMNPLMKCGEHLDEMLRDRPAFAARTARRAEILRRLAEVGITDPTVAERMPFQLSGGMCQRVALAAALARDPDLLIADEPSTALDVTTQAEIMRLLRTAQQQRGMGLILITHDLRLAFSTCQRICVLYAGSVVEMGSTTDVSAAPFHPYTTGLLLSEPPVGQRVRQLVAIPGSVPAADTVSNQCTFADRCTWVATTCRAARPALVVQAPGHLSACIRLGEIAAELEALRQSAFEPDDAAVEARGNALLKVDGLVKTFGSHRGPVRAVKGVSLHIAPGESLGLVGESGSGKTTIGRCVVGLERPTEGRIAIAGIDATDYDAMSDADRRSVRRTVQMVFQDPYSTLNPRHSVRTILSEAVRIAGATETSARIPALLKEVGLSPSYATRRPSSLSGGERQRIAVARALAVEPRLLVCDEPVSALDVSVQAQVLNLLKSLQKARGLSLLFITHDLAVVRQVADRIAVLYLGEVVETGPVADVMDNPQHGYTRRLLSSVPSP